MIPLAMYIWIIDIFPPFMEHLIIKTPYHITHFMQRTPDAAVKTSTILFPISLQVSLGQLQQIALSQPR